MATHHAQAMHAPSEPLGGGPACVQQGHGHTTAGFQLLFGASGFQGNIIGIPALFYY
jgi:hypothetical protein